MKIIKIVFSKIKKINSSIKWIIQAKKIRKNINFQHKINTKIEENQKILILIPHSDDEWVGCSSILKLKDVQIYNAYLGFGSIVDEIKKVDIRKYETTKLLDRYKLNLLDVSNNRKNDLKNIIKELAPDIIFTPSYIDWHEEHIETTKLLLEVLIDINKNHNLYNPKISMYQVSVPLKLEQITHCIPMNKKELFSKWYIFFKTYLSQRYLPIVRFALNEYINGKMINCFSGEVFSISEYDEWEYNFKKFLTQYKDIGFLKTYINDLELIREEVKKL